MMMIRVTYIITIIADDTRHAIEENLPFEEAYVMCNSVPLEPPNKIIGYVRPQRSLFSQRYDHGIFKALERSTLIQIGSKYDCVLRVKDNNVKAASQHTTRPSTLCVIRG
jgi:hypothetical protein